jgi:hypothetical protein
LRQFDNAELFKAAYEFAVTEGFRHDNKFLARRRDLHEKNHQGGYFLRHIPLSGTLLDIQPTLPWGPEKKGTQDYRIHKSIRYERGKDL